MLNMIYPGPQNNVMDQRINSTVYVKVLKCTHEIPTERQP